MTRCLSGFMMPEMFSRSPLPLRSTILVTGVLVSCALAIGGAMATPGGAQPSFSDTSAALFACFFVLNPVHLVLVALPLPRAPDLLGALLAVAVDLGWWWVISCVIARFIQRRRAAKVRATD